LGKKAHRFSPFLYRGSIGFIPLAESFSFSFHEL
jgi:hypothetical protein